MKTSLALLLFVIGLTGASHFALAQEPEKKPNAYYTTLNLKEIKKRYTQKRDVFLDSTKNKIDAHIAKIQKDPNTALIIRFIHNPLAKTMDYENIDEKINEFYTNMVSLEGGSLDKHNGGLLKLVNQTAGFQSILIDGTAKYIADRFKEEATRLYINRFRETLMLTPYTDFNQLTPETYNYLMTGNLFDFKNVLGEIKENFETDLDNILVGLKDFTEKGTATSTFRQNQDDIYRAVFFSLDLGQKLKEKKSFKEIIDYLDLTYVDKGGFNNYYNLVHSINLLQENLRREDDNSAGLLEYKNYWLTSGDLAKLDDSKDFEYFLSLIYNHTEGPKKDNKTFFDALINKLITERGRNPLLFKEYVFKVINIYQSIERLQSNNQIQALSYVELVSHLTDLLKLINDKAAFLDKSYITITSHSINIAKTILKKNYINTVPEGIKLLALILKDKPTESEKIIAKFKKYGTFMVDIVSAQNSDEMKDAIAKNVTDYTYSDKRRNRFSWTLNADPGLVPAVEGLRGPFNAAKFAFGITCPIGFDFVWGAQTNKNYNGLSINILDIGAAFAYRFGDSASQLPEKITLKQVFAPGIAFKNGIKNTPISWAIGYQYLPALRSITTDGITEAKNASRVLLRFTWDMPLVKFKGTKDKGEKQ